MCALNKYDAYIVDSELDTRMRLKQVTTSVPNFGKVTLLSSPREAISKLTSSVDPCDVIFVSHHFEQNDVANFIRDAKATKAGQDCAYILVLQSSDQESGKVAKNMMIGADGQLFEPYSVEYLVEITHLAARVKLERAQSREEAAMRFLVTDIMNQVDICAYMKASGYDVTRHVKKLKEFCTIFGTLSPQSVDTYYQVAISMFENAPLPKAVPQRKTYGGASSRVRKKQEEKLVAELEKQVSSDKPPA
jgi:DNA-binding NarL/FixJ family response regulator